MVRRHAERVTDEGTMAAQAGPFVGRRLCFSCGRLAVLLDDKTRDYPKRLVQDSVEQEEHEQRRLAMARLWLFGSC